MTWWQAKAETGTLYAFMLLLCVIMRCLAHEVNQAWRHNLLAGFKCRS